MKPIRNCAPSSQAGFSLAEIMIGLTIGMLATLVIVQVMSAFEAQKRVTTGTADAQTNGGIALYNIERELQLAGYPLLPVAVSPLECTALNYGISGVTSIAPVTITDGGAGAGASDSITVRYGDSTAGGVPTTIASTSAPLATVASSFGCQVGDVTLLTKGTFCAMSIVSGVTATSGLPGTVTLADTSSFGASSVGAGSTLACLGKWNQITYAVNNGNLERNGVPIVSGIVNIQAQYGISTTANSNQVTLWVNATGITWATPSVANRNRIKAVRIAILARNSKTEPAAVTSPCSVVLPNGPCAWAGSASSPAPTIDLSNDPTWANYHYRMFDTIVPLRNVIWSKSTL